MKNDFKDFEDYKYKMDTKLEDKVICPYCGSVQEDVWDYDLKDDDDSTTTECGNCGEEFNVSMQLNPKYTTTKMIEDREEYWTF